MSALPDVQFERGLPADMAAERSILGSVLLDNELYYEAAERIVEEDFALDAHRKLFEAMGHLLNGGHPVDYITMRDELARRKWLEAIGGIAYMASLTENLPRKLSIAEYVRIVHEKSLLRQTIAQMSEAITEAADQATPALDIVGRVQQGLSGLAEKGAVSGFVSVEQAILARHGSIDGFRQGASRKNAISLGYPRLDAALGGGLRRGELMVLAARPAMGKTALAVCIACNAGLRGDRRVGIFEAEMTNDALIRRMINSELPPSAEIDTERMRDNRLTPEQDRIVMERLGRLVDSDIVITDAGPFTISVLGAKARRLNRGKQLDLLIVDYIQLLDGSRRHDKRVDEVSEVSRGLKLLAKELDVPIIALSQLNRDCEKRVDKRPQLSDLRDSGAIEQDADIVAFLYRDEVYYKDQPEFRGTAELILAKQREGPLETIRMVYMGARTRFEERLGF